MIGPFYDITNNALQWRTTIPPLILTIFCLQIVIKGYIRMAYQYWEIWLDVSTQVLSWQILKACDPCKLWPLMKSMPIVTTFSILQYYVFKCRVWHTMQWVLVDMIVCINPSAFLSLLFFLLCLQSHYTYSMSMTKSRAKNEYAMYVCITLH